MCIIKDNNSIQDKNLKSKSKFAYYKFMKVREKFAKGKLLSRLHWWKILRRDKSLIQISLGKL